MKPDFVRAVTVCALGVPGDDVNVPVTGRPSLFSYSPLLEVAFSALPVLVIANQEVAQMAGTQ